MLTTGGRHSKLTADNTSSSMIIIVDDCSVCIALCFVNSLHGVSCALRSIVRLRVEVEGKEESYSLSREQLHFTYYLLLLLHYLSIRSIRKLLAETLSPWG